MGALADSHIQICCWVGLSGPLCTLRLFSHITTCLLLVEIQVQNSHIFFFFLPVYQWRGRYPKSTFSTIAVFNTVTPLSPALCSSVRVGKQNKGESSVKGSHSPPPAYKPFSLDPVLEAAFTPACCLQPLGQSTCSPAEKCLCLEVQLLPVFPLLQLSRA